MIMATVAVRAARGGKATILSSGQTTMQDTEGCGAGSMAIVMEAPVAVVIVVVAAAVGGVGVTVIRMVTPTTEVSHLMSEQAALVTALARMADMECGRTPVQSDAAFVALSVGEP